MARKVEEIVLKISVDDSKSIEKLRKYNNEAGKADEKNKSLISSFRGLKGVLAGLGLLKFGKEASQVALQYDKIENSLNTVTGSAYEAKKELEFLESISDDLGVRVTSLAGEYTKLFAAMKGANIGKEITRELIMGVSELSTAMGLAEDDTAGITRAISQMGAKGKISTEELHQLGERGVDAFGLASRAIGVSTRELTKMLEQGEIMSDDFLPKFANQLRKEFAEPAKQAIGSAQANINRLKNEWERSVRGMGDAINSFIPILSTGMSWANNFADGLGNIVHEANLLTDALLGVESVTGSNEEAQRLIDIGKRKRLQMEETEEIKKKKSETDRLVASMEKLQSINQLGIDILNAESLKSIKEELSLTEQEFQKLSPAILDALSKGAGIDDLKNSLKSFISSFKEDLNSVNEEIQLKVKNPFDELIKGATQFNQALDLSKTLGLNKKEFDKVKFALKEAIDKNIDPKSLKAKIAGLRDLGFFDEGKSKKSSSPRPTSAVQTLFEKGASASAFLQDKTVEFEQVKINYLKIIAENSKKDKDKPNIVAK